MNIYQRHTVRCLRCGFIWQQAVKEGAPLAKACPKCNSPDWNKSKSLSEKE
jgi:ssDNA-binding Zn-finger/Zn-ribbon topoisomerase 1